MHPEPVTDQVGGSCEGTGYMSPTTALGTVRTGRVSATSEGCVFHQTAVEGTPRSGDVWDDDQASITFEWSSVKDYRFDEDLESVLVHLKLSLPYELVVETTDEENRGRWEDVLAGHGIKKVG